MNAIALILVVIGFLIDSKKWLVSSIPPIIEYKQVIGVGLIN